MKEALKLALEALQWSKPHKDAVITHSEAITAIVEALAQPTSGDYALGYAEGFNDACKPAQPVQPVALPDLPLTPYRRSDDSPLWDTHHLHAYALRYADMLTSPPAAQPAQEPWCMKMNGCTTKCLDCPDEPAQQCLDCGSNNIGIPATYDSLIDSVKTLQENT